MAIAYKDQTLTIPADVCKILERGRLLDHSCDDFGLTIEIENGELKITDLMEYIVKGYVAMEPEEAWDLVRKWLKKLQEESKVEIAINSKRNQIAKLQSEVEKLENSKRTWRLW